MAGPTKADLEARVKELEAQLAEQDVHAVVKDGVEHITERGLVEMMRSYVRNMESPFSDDRVAANAIYLRIRDILSE